MAAFFYTLASRLRHPWSSSASTSLTPEPSPSSRSLPWLSSNISRPQGSVDETLLCAFRLLDQNNDGFVSVKEFCEGLHKLGIHIPHRQMSDLLKLNSSSGLLSFYQFQYLYASLCSNPAEPDLREAEDRVERGVEKIRPKGGEGEAILKHPDEGSNGQLFAHKSTNSAAESQLNGNHGRSNGKINKFNRKEGNFGGTVDSLESNKENLKVNENKLASFSRNGDNVSGNSKESNANTVKFHGKVDNLLDSHINHNNKEASNKTKFGPSSKNEKSYDDDNSVRLEAFRIHDKNADGCVASASLSTEIQTCAFRS